MWTSRSSLLARRTIRHVAQSHDGGVPGANLPFNIHKRGMFTFKFCLFFATAFSAPYLVAGKTKLANFLSESNLQVPEDFDVVEPLRIVEYDLNDVQIEGTPADVDVQIWDANGDDKFMAFWAVFRKNVDGIVFVYNQEDEIGAQKLDYMYNFFVSQPNRSLRTCLVCCVEAEENNAKLSSAFSKISRITANLDAPTEKIKQDFSKFVVTVVNTIINK